MTADSLPRGLPGSFPPWQRFADYTTGQLEEMAEQAQWRACLGGSELSLRRWLYALHATAISRTRKGETLCLPAN
ncbi:hypothetical protein [Nocardia terpenica]|uniref:hypothetical protein n=1 Tax=Nocardia terpenica TaxID=455432 RepID=UPI00030D0818|nr:hypothetical protein [Nocardia terpenica]NQE89728.1 hypothetical protein [Nocardia terpenica]